MASKDSNTKLTGLSALAFQLSVRLRLIWIWFIKNIWVWVKILTIVAVIMVACGLINGELDGVGEYEALGKTIDWLVGIGGSIAYTICAIVKKTKRILLTDIKSRNLKIAMIKANLYFDENGKICKKIEAKTNLDIDGDGAVGDSIPEDIHGENLIEGITRSASELHTILTTPIDPNATDEDIVETAELTQSEQAEEPNEEITANIETDTTDANDVEDDPESSDVESITEDDIKESKAAAKAAKKLAKAEKKKEKASKPKTGIAKIWSAATGKVGAKITETKKVMSKSKDILFEKKEKTVKSNANKSVAINDAAAATLSAADASGIEVVNTGSDFGAVAAAKDATTASSDAATAVKAAPVGVKPQTKQTAKDKEISDLLNSI